MIRSVCKRHLRTVMAAVDRLLRKRDPSYSEAPLFIVGPPRSGTTVIYQLLVHCLRTAYFCNCADVYFRSPLCAAWIMRGGLRNYVSDFKSDHGATEGRIGPSQGDRIWARWMGDQRSYVGASDIPVKAMVEMRRTIGHISRIMDAPFVNKSVTNSVRIPALAGVFPHALFLWVVRDTFQTVQSQFLSRRKAMAGDKEEQKQWMSAKPREYESIKGLPLVEQVCAQIHYLHKNIESDLHQFARGRYTIIRYEDVCENPGRSVAQIEELWREHGTHIRRRFEPPLNFVVSRGVKVDMATRDQIVRIMNELGTFDGTGAKSL